METFLEDDAVKDFIDNMGEKVNISGDSDPGLTAGNGRISALNPDRYYIIEEWSESAVFLNVQFVTSGGTRNPNLISIGKVTGRTITGLTNNYTYRVKSAAPLPGNITYYDLPSPPATPPAGGTQVPIVNGAVTLSAAIDKYYMTIPYIDEYEIVKLPITPSGATADITGDIIGLQGQNTTTDYLFYYPDSDINADNFYLLKVIITGRPQVEITIFYEETDIDNTLTITPTNLTVSQESLLGGVYEIFINSTAQDFDPAGVEWIYNNHSGTGAVFNFAGHGVDHLVPGLHTITIEIRITRGAETYWYSRVLTIVVL
jgi:hypothetical protein